MVKIIGGKVSDKLFTMVTTEISKLGLTKSQFLRLVLNNYFNERKSDDNLKVNLPKRLVNPDIDEDKYQRTCDEVDSFLCRLRDDNEKRENSRL